MDPIDESDTEEDRQRKREKNILFRIINIKYIVNCKHRIIMTDNRNALYCECIQYCNSM